MTDNLDLWHRVEKTPIEHTKAITGKSYSGTSPKPHYIIQKATETFGPAGIGWGFTVEERIEDGAMIEAGFHEKMHVAKVKVWFLWNEKRGEVEHIGGTVFSGKRKNGQIFTDEDAPKKSVTDALIKALSMIGFAGDIFMGRYDDSKYTNELREEAAEEKRTATKKIEKVVDLRPKKNDPLLTEGSDAASRGMDILKVFWTRLSVAEKKLVGGEEQLNRWKATARQADAAAESTPFDDADLGDIRYAQV